MPQRLPWPEYFMRIAYMVSERSTCIRRRVGCVLVKDKRILATGYNGAPSGLPTCKERGECLRRKLGVASGTHAEICYAVHAEQNAIIQAARLGVSIDGATLYCTHQPCSLCTRMIINAGLSQVVIRRTKTDYDIVNVQDWIEHDDSIADPAKP